MITVSSLTKRFGSFEAVRNVTFSVPAGAFLVLVGPSGCGKSTMLRMLAGLEAPSAGTIRFGDVTVSDGARAWTIEPGRRNVGLVFQSYALWPHMTVGGNVDWPLKVAGWPATERRARVDEVLGLLGIDALAGRYPNEISGGQQQRVAIARMIGPRPGILLFDEPLSNLDAKLRVDMRSELLKVHRATGATSVYVTHDQVEAMTMATHVAVMNGGVVEQFGPPDQLIENPASAFVATFVGTPPANLLPVVRGPEGTRVHGVPLEVDIGPRTEALAMYRAEDLALTAEEAGQPTLAVEFVEASPVAGRTMLTGIRDGIRITAVVDGRPRVRVGETLRIRLPERAAALFSTDGARLS